MTIAIYDANNAFILDSEVNPNFNDDDCDWQLNIKHDDDVIPSVGPCINGESIRCTIDDDWEQPLTIRFYRGFEEIPDEDYYFAYAGPALNNQERFYEPFGAVAKDQDFHFRYYSGDQAFGRGMYTTPMVLKNAPQGFTEQFLGDSWVLPYNSDYHLRAIDVRKGSGMR
jgi:hypothetical protein